MKILIIRHGEPDYSIDSLTHKGWHEAELLSERLCRMRLDGLYVSPMGRARDTARPTLEKLGREAEVLDWLHEFRGCIVNPNSGQRSLPWNLSPQYWTKQPELYDRQAWRENGLFRSGDVAEVYDATAAGVDTLLARYGYVRDGGIWRCAGNDETTIVLFCHFGVGMVMLSYLLDVSPSVMWQCFFMPASSVTTLVTEERVKGEVFFKCMQLGDTSHLYAGSEQVSKAGLYREVFGRGDVKEAQ